MGIAEVLLAVFGTFALVIQILLLVHSNRNREEEKSPLDYALQNALERNEYLTNKLEKVKLTNRIEEQNKIMEDALERELAIDYEDSFRKLHDRFKEAESHRIHKISTVDTLTSIAKEYGTTVDELSNMNSIRFPRDFAVGNALIIPEED